MGIVLGVFGVHKFYLGYQTEGIIMLVISLVGGFLCGFPAAAVAIVGLIEGILYLTKPDEEFVVTYVTGRRPWFGVDCEPRSTARFTLFQDDLL